MKQIRKRLTYANVMSSIAMFMVLGGATAFAATKIGANEIKANSIKTGKIVKEAVTAGKIKNAAITTGKLATAAVTADKLAEKSVTGAKLDLPTLGVVPTAANAEKLGGKSPASYESKGLATGNAANTTLPANTTTAARTLNLPAGTYLILGVGQINNNGAAPTAAGAVSCQIVAGGGSQEADFGVLNQNSQPGDREAFSLPLLATLEAPGTATLSCTTPGVWTGNVLDTEITAVSLQP